MSDTPTHSHDNQQSNTSRWILLGGILVVVVSVLLLIVGAFLAQRDRTYESIPTNEINETTSEDGLTEETGTDHEHLSLTHEHAVHNHAIAVEEIGEQATSQDVALKASTDPLASLEGSVTWARVDEETVQDSEVPSFPRVIVDRALVRVNTTLRSMIEGNQIQFPIPQRDVVLIGKVTEIGGPPRARSIKGEVDDEGEKYPFVLTLGDRSTFATIMTSTGNYELFANLNYGWLMPSANMDDHVDYSIPDHFVENPDPHAHVENPPP